MHHVSGQSMPVGPGAAAPGAAPASWRARAQSGDSLGHVPVSPGGRAAAAWCAAWTRGLWALLLALAAVCLAPGARAQGLLAVPELTARVIDQTGTLSPPQRQALEAKLQAVETELGSQIVVLMVPTTAPEDIAAYAFRVADTWKIGRRDVGDGLLVVVAKDDRRVRIEVAKTLEGAIPDLMARRVIDRAIVPAFRANDYYRGLDDAVDLLGDLIRGEGLPAPEAGRGADEGTQWSDLLIFLMVGAPLIGAVMTGIFGRRLGSLAAGGAIGMLGWQFTASLLVALGVGVLGLLFTLVLGTGAARGSRVARSSRHGAPPVIWGGGGGGFGGGFGGGGFSSGGGGGFGGGGASGDW